MVAIALLLGSAGCGSDDGQPERPVRATLDLEVEAAGPPDAGERAGHGGIYIAAAQGPRVTFTGRATPRDAEIKVTGARANVRIDGVVASVSNWTASDAEPRTSGSMSPVLTERHGYVECGSSALAPPERA